MPLHERIERPEADVATLLDMLIDAIAAQRQAPVTTIKAVKNPRSWLLQYLSFDTWIHRTEVQAASGRKQSAVDMALHAAKKLGLAESRQGYWRKTPKGAV
jgi:hypothetical protein